MSDDVALNLRKTLNRPAVEDEVQRIGRPQVLLLLVGLIGVAGLAGFLSSGAIQNMRSWPTMIRIFGQPPTALAADASPQPRIMAVVPGVREVTVAGADVPFSGSALLSQLHMPRGPVFLRRPDGYVEIDSPRLKPPPLGPMRGGDAVFDHALVLANELRTLAFTPCDRRLRHLAAANINLFIAGFMQPRTPFDRAASADVAFWRRPEANIVRRTVFQLAEKGAFALSDFGLDVSPQARGLFEGLPTRQIICG